LDDYLQIAGLPFKMSPAMMAETAFFGLHEGSFASAEQMIRKYLPTRISDTLIREVTEYAGRKTFAIVYLRRQTRVYKKHNYLNFPYITYIFY
jgi:hypothetical protein